MLCDAKESERSSPEMFSSSPFLTELLSAEQAVIMFCLAPLLCTGEDSAGKALKVSCVKEN